MARRDFDFSTAEKNQAMAAFNFVCAACGADDGIHIDHWVSGDKGIAVCLCFACNGAKSDIKVPVDLALVPRQPLEVITHAEYKLQIAANRKAFAIWVSRHRSKIKLKTVYWKAPF